jgi:hypothetical protein
MDSSVITELALRLVNCFFAGVEWAAAITFVIVA